MIQPQLLKFLSFSIILVTISSVAGFLQIATGIQFANTTLWWILHTSILLLFYLGKKYLFDKANEQNMAVVKWYLIWNVFSIVRGLFVAETYWDWKGLMANTMALLIPIVAYSASNKDIFQSIMSSYIKYTLPLFFIICIFISKDAYGFFLVPVSFLTFFIPVLTFRWRLVVLLFSIVVLFADLGARSNVIKFAVPFLFLIIYLTRLILPVKLLEVFRKGLFIMPFVLLFLAISGTFNIFKIEEYVEGDYVVKNTKANGESNEENLTTDTRTGLYTEVLQTAQKHNTWLIGRSPARGNETEWFAEGAEISGRQERLANEVAILNIFTWTGIIGVILFLFVFYKASYLALNHSNNIYCKILGVFVAFRWVYAWVEDINSFTLTYFFLWLMLGFCFSKSFRSMTDTEIKFWVRGIFDNKYRKIVFVHQFKSIS